MSGNPPDHAEVAAISLNMEKPASPRAGIPTSQQHLSSFPTELQKLQTAGALLPPLLGAQRNISEGGAADTSDLTELFFYGD